MKHKITYLVALLFLSGSFLSAESETKNAVISNHADLAKSEIDRKCHRIQKKINRLEVKLSNELSEERRLSIMNKINKYTEILNSLRTLRESMETIKSL